MFRPEPLTQRVLWSVDGGKPHLLSHEQADRLLGFFHETEAAAEFNALHEAYVEVGGIPYLSGRAA